jgi:uncharacterized membrane protein
MEKTEVVAISVPTRRWAEVGELWMVGAVVGYASAYLFDRFAVVRVDPVVATFIKNLPVLVLGATLIFTKGTYRQLRPSSVDYIGRYPITIFVIGGVLISLGTFSYYYALRLGGINITVPVTQTAVFWGIVVSWLYLGEKYNWRGVFGIALLVVGLVVLSYGQTIGIPVSAHWYYAIPLALLSALGWGLTGVIWRDGQLRGADQSTAIFVQFASKAVFIAMVIASMGRLGLMMTISKRDLMALLISGLLSGLVAQYCLFMALRVMSVARVYALNSLNPILAAVLAYFVIHEYINATMAAGLIMASAGVVLVQIFKPKYERKAG